MHDLLPTRFSRRQWYWICQGTGWGTLILLNAFVFTLYHGIDCSVTWLDVLISISIIGLALTHLMRLYIHRAGWLALSMLGLLTRIVGSSFFLSLVMLGLIIGVTRFFLHCNYFTDEAGRTVDFILNGWMHLTLWLALYFGFHYVESRNKAEIDKWKMNAALQMAELEALKAQMNPHFLFNSLNNLEELVLEDPNKAREALSKLSALLRYALQSSKSQTVPLGEELRIVRHYIDLEQIRFEDRLQTTLEVDPATLATPIPPLMVQTLVENGVKHGIARRPQGGNITISTQTVDDGVRLVVSNDGAICQSATESGLGLANTRERLHLLFGADAKVSLEHSMERVTASVFIPRIVQGQIV